MKPERVIALISAIEKRFQTTMIGSLARIEDHFGFIWGHDKEMISIEQSDNRNVWQDLREDILDHCNYQMRSALTDLRKFLQEENKDQFKLTKSFKSQTQLNNINQGE